MNVERGLLGAYRLLLQLYPPAFRQRFAPEMLELAAAAEPAEWPLIFGDTGVAIVRCWVEGTESTAVLAEPNAYLALGESPVRAFGLLQGFALSLAIIAGLCFVSYRWPTDLPAGCNRLTHIVAAPQLKAPAPEPHQRLRDHRSQQERQN